MANPLPLAIRERAAFIAAVAVILFLTLLTSVTSPADAARSLVTVYADGEERVVSTTVLTVGEALERSGIELGPHDLVEPGLDTFINDAAFRINVYRAKPITIVDGDVQATVMSPYDSPRLIAESVGIEVYPEDGFHFELIDDILFTGSLGQRLVIDRAMPVNISLYGETIEHRTHAETVGEVLEEAGVVLGVADETSIPLDSSISEGDTVAVIRTGKEVISENVKVQHPIEKIYDSNMFQGQVDIRTPGFDAIDLVTYEVELENGEEVSRKEISRVNKKPAVTEVQVVGTKVADPSSNIAIGQSLAAARGWTGEQWQCLYSLWQKESNWNHLAENPSSGAYGIPQSLPGTKMAARGADWRTNPTTQMQWGLDYIGARYGTPCGAWDHSVQVNWY